MNNNPERKATRFSTKNFIGMKSTPHLITRDHDPRRADQCNLHTHVIANNNKSPIEKPMSGVVSSFNLYLFYFINRVRTDTRGAVRFLCFVLFS